MSLTHYISVVANQQTLGKLTHGVALCEHMSHASDKVLNIDFPRILNSKLAFCNIGRLFSWLASKLN